MCVDEHTFWGLHPVKDYRSKEVSQGGKQGTGKYTERDSGMDSFPDSFQVSFPERCGDDHPCTYENTLKKPYQEHNKAGDGGNGCQSLLAHKVSHHQGISCVIKLLKQVPKENREGKSDKVSLD